VRPPPPPPQARASGSLSLGRLPAGTSSCNPPAEAAVAAAAGMGRPTSSGPTLRPSALLHPSPILPILPIVN
jgi:hypothetical protein